MTDLAAKTLLGNHWWNLSAQFLIVMFIALLYIYWIVRRRADSVVILSHSRLWISTACATVFAIVYYRGLMHFVGYASNWKRSIVYFGLAFISWGLWAGLVNIFVYWIDQGKSLKDFKKNELELWNCNWPLIRRCVSQSLTHLYMFGVIFAFRGAHK